MNILSVVNVLVVNRNFSTTETDTNHMLLIFYVYSKLRLRIENVPLYAQISIYDIKFYTKHYIQ